MILPSGFPTVVLCAALWGGCTSEEDLPSGADATAGDLSPGDGSNDTSSAIDPQACQRTATGPFVRDLQAAPNAASAATVRADGQVYELELIADFAGWVIYEAQRGGRVLLYLGVEAPLTVHDNSGSAIELAGSEAIVGCERLTIRYAVDLPRADSYLLRVGGSGVPQQKTLLVLEETG